MSNTVTIPSPTDVGALANRINLHTRDAHNKIDSYMSVQIAFALKHGFIYRQGILALYFVFRAIEQELDRLLESPITEDELQASKILKQFWCEEFRRADKLVMDLQVLYSKEYPTENELQVFLDTFKLPPKLQGFVDYIHNIILQKPYTILSFCHVLYLALFAGGKVIRSNLYRHTGLFPKFGHLSTKELVKRGTNFFTFSEHGIDEERKLRWEYKKNYELSTRDELTEEQKNVIIQVSSDIFKWTMDVFSELGEINKQELMSKLSFKLITLFIEEWKYNEKLSKGTKQIILLSVLFINILIVYYFFKNFMLN